MFGGKYVVSKTELFVRRFFFWFNKLYHLILRLLVMVDIECSGGCFDRRGDDTTSKLSLWIIFVIDQDCIGQLRRANSKFSSFVLIRVVHLTIETNTLTGTSPGKLHSDVHLTYCIASLAIASVVLYAAFPASRTNILYDLFSDLITLFTFTE